MYNKRIRIFAILIFSFLAVCLLRLVQMQLVNASFYRGKIADLEYQSGDYKQLRTIRGRILDRKGKILADNELAFELCINYQQTQFMDSRCIKAGRLVAASKKENADAELKLVNRRIKTAVVNLDRIIDKCSGLGMQRSVIEEKIKQINDSVWNVRTHLAWKRYFPQYDSFEQALSDANDRLVKAWQVDIAEMYRSWPLFELKDNNDCFSVQLEFMDVNGIEVSPKVRRIYPCGSVAAQTIGWVGRPQEIDKEPFEDDRLLKYLDDELCGREDGVEYACEALLRGKRGLEVYDIDKELVNRTETRPGRDVSLTIDIELQKKIEDYLAGRTGIAAVVIDVQSGQILAIVSMPVFDLNRVRYEYAKMAFDPNKPMLNRVINQQYPPGSVIKPIILIAAMETGKITPDEIISCPPRRAPPGWPSCWLYRDYHLGHDNKWPNNAHNALKGSCNIYFSRLADRLESSQLQKWLFDFGYGRGVLHPPAVVESLTPGRNLRQAQGRISSGRPPDAVADLAQLPPLADQEKRFFGIGQGNLSATPLQVANAMAAVARGGLYKSPQLFMENGDGRDSNAVPLNISRQTLNVVRNGMSAVVNEMEGTAYNEFAHTGFAAQSVRVCGKTGSTERPFHAWFAGFAENTAGRSIALAVVVEGGKRGSAEAAPLARDIIQFCIDAGYI